MSDTQVMTKPVFEDSFEENEELTESQVSRLRDVSEPAPAKRPEVAKPETGKAAADDTDRVSVVGETLHFKGELTASEDLVIEGTVEGTINQGKCCLTVKPKGRLLANVNATKIFVEGKVTGDLHATVSVKVRRGGEVEGNIVAPTVALEDGSKFNGCIEMRSPSDG